MGQSDRDRVKLTVKLKLVVAVILLAAGSLYAIAFFRGNLALIGCLRSYYSEKPGLSTCDATQGTYSQQKTLSFVQMRDLWRSFSYLQLAGKCGESLCDCFPEETHLDPSLHDRLQAYYAALAYRLVNGEFPMLDNCTAVLAPSRYILLESESVRRAGQEELADVMHELAYRVDRDWEDHRQRGCSAFKQAMQYLDGGERQAAKGAFDKAIDSLQQVYRPDDGPVVSCMSQSLFFLAEIDADEGNWEDAIQGYRQSIGSSPNVVRKGFRELVRIWQQRGNEVAYMLRQFEEMRTSFGVSDPYLTSGPAFAFLEAGMVDAARQFLDSAPVELGGETVILRARGLVCERSGDMGCARQHYSTAFAGTLDSEPRVAAELASDLARIDAALGDTSRAISHSQLAIELNPQSPAYWYQLAQFYRQAGELDNARRTLEEGLSRHPENSTLRTALDELMGTNR